MPRCVHGEEEFIRGHRSFLNCGWMLWQEVMATFSGHSGKGVVRRNFRISQNDG